jgi:hypothetical protein
MVTLLGSKPPPPRACVCPLDDQNGTGRRRSSRQANGRYRFLSLPPCVESWCPIAFSSVSAGAPVGRSFSEAFRRPVLDRACHVYRTAQGVPSVIGPAHQGRHRLNLFKTLLQEHSVRRPAQGRRLLCCANRALVPVTGAPRSAQSRSSFFVSPQPVANLHSPGTSSCPPGPFLRSPITLASFLHFASAVGTLGDGNSPAFP